MRSLTFRRVSGVPALAAALAAAAALVHRIGIFGHCWFLAANPHVEATFPLRAARSAATRHASSHGEAHPNGNWQIDAADLQTVPGQKVRHLLLENPAIVDDAVEREFEELERQRLEEDEELKPQATLEKEISSDLRSRMGEVRQGERQRAAAELLYLATAMELWSIGASPVRPVGRGGFLNFAGEPSDGALTEFLHSAEALEAIKEHLNKSFVPGANLHPDQMLRLTLFNVGQAYAATMLFGYVVRRAEQRLKLERMMGSEGSYESGNRALQRYIGSFGPNIIKEVMTSFEAQLAAELHIQAVFGDLQQLKMLLHEELLRVAPRGPDDIQNVIRCAVEQGTVPSVQVRVRELRRVMLEAAAFGTLLHQTEQEVQSRYEFSPAVGNRLDRFGVDMHERGDPFSPH